MRIKLGDDPVPYDLAYLIITSNIYPITFRSMVKDDVVVRDKLDLENTIADLLTHSNVGDLIHQMIDNLEVNNHGK